MCSNKREGPKHQSVTPIIIYPFFRTITIFWIVARQKFLLWFIFLSLKKVLLKNNRYFFPFKKLLFPLGYPPQSCECAVWPFELDYQWTFHFTHNHLPWGKEIEATLLPLMHTSKDSSMKKALFCNIDFLSSISVTELSTTARKIPVACTLPPPQKSSNSERTIL